MRALFLLGRTIFGGYFLWNGINHFQHRKMLAGYAGSKGTPAPETAVPASGGLLVTGGASIIAGMNTRQGLLAIVAFLVPVSLQMHRFWDVEDPSARQAEMINFTKNMALVGAALMLMQLPTPWPDSVDEARAPREDMYVHLAGRELRALPH
jgi:uncharacterized membrane protein YphA (DoxX/SURF4 family)